MLYDSMEDVTIRCTYQNSSKKIITILDLYLFLYHKKLLVLSYT